MPRTPNLTQAAPARQQMDRSNDPEEARAMEAAAPAAAMASRRQRFAGAATGVGSVGFRESGAFDVGAGNREGVINPDPTSDPAPVTGPAPGAADLRRDSGNDQ
ncbi:MAG TPA: Tat pathway signal protein [Brevundimonas sp.]|jgi:hypothetical protein|uniref:Tat pathway signal protein n=1 Tax=Brevundimonas sp. TaxID=1871086 RepID=UPI002E0D74A8|nr:Tat pathway signal protein [Brevundimonas sp.]